MNEPPALADNEFHCPTEGCDGIFTATLEQLHVGYPPSLTYRSTCSCMFSQIGFTEVNAAWWARQAEVAMVRE